MRTGSPTCRRDSSQSDKYSDPSKTFLQSGRNIRISTKSHFERKYLEIHCTLATGLCIFITNLRVSKINIHLQELDFLIVRMKYNYAIFCTI